MKQLLSIFFILAIGLKSFGAEERVLQFRNGAALVSGTNGQQSSVEHILHDY
jgi:hypothetical protein